MTKTRIDAWLRRAGLAAGLLIGVLAVLGWRVPHGSGRLGLDLQMSASQTGEAGVSPLTPFLRASGLEAGKSAAGSFSVRNETAKTLSVRLRASADPPDADGIVRVRLESQGAALYDGPLGGLRVGTTAAIRIPRASARDVHVTASVPRSAGGAVAGRIVDVQLAPVVRR